MTGLLVDTGFLVALFDSSDSKRSFARAFLQSNRLPLVTVGPVIVETCYFLDPQHKQRLLEWVHRKALAVADLPVSAYPALSTIIAKYADRDIDFTDAALVWLAGETGVRSILTVDEKNFGIYRLKGGKRFEVVRWFE
jgi:predicted nucleic acid-binding protein